MLDPARKKNYEKSTIGISSKSVRVWWDLADRGLLLPAIGRSPPLRPHCLRRDTHLRWLPHRHRLPLPLQRIIGKFIVLFCSPNAAFAAFH